MDLYPSLNLKQFCKEHGIRFNKYPRPYTFEHTELLRDAFGYTVNRKDAERESGLNYCLLVNGNGSWWDEETGSLAFDWPSQKEYDKQVAYRQIEIDEQEKKDAGYFGALGSDERNEWDARKLKFRAEMENGWAKAPMEFYPIARGYARVTKMPDNVNDNWLKVAFEVLDLVINAESTERNDENRPLAIEIKAELEARFADRLLAK